MHCCTAIGAGNQDKSRDVNTEKHCRDAREKRGSCRYQQNESLQLGEWRKDSLPRKAGWGSGRKGRQGLVWVEWPCEADLL